MSAGAALPRAPLLAGAGALLPAPADRAGRKNLLLLIQLRWIAVAGQVVSILLVAFGLGASLPLAPMAAVVGGLVALNLFSVLRLSRRVRVDEGELFVSLALDVAALTAQLYFSGGTENPFAPLYLLQVTLGAVLLGPATLTLLVALAIACFAWLTGFHRPLPLLEPGGAGTIDARVVGMLLCFMMNSVLLVTFVTRINRNARERDERLAMLRQRAAEEDHIVRIGLLASGAAHELGTPLSTLSIILGDWQRMPQLAGDPELAGELALMRAEVARCKSIVTGVLMAAGETRGESAAGTTMFAFLDGLAAEWRASRPQAGLTYENRVDENLPVVSESTLRQGVFNLLDNAFEVSPQAISLVARREGETLVLTVEDEGPGFAPHILSEVGRPYQSTKDRHAAGLGLFLVFNVVRTLGGTVEVANRPQGGARVALRLPLAALEIEREEEEESDAA
ncbi:ATP-binding protein [Aurantimonas sp. Leaf443]|uniref:ATP-binding protein n=1 Tax=Aurantimonas sp. Leaf443 TaxID=1736378 RepID=UPI0006FAD659|nr:ATP-binding protein [Aurantimonas sp. Leaf443]KQT87145.1 histidine kinase [Aurantimonas sp. Leaf443]